MLISEDGHTIILGNVGCAWRRTYGAAKVFLGLVGIACLIAPPLLAIAFESEATEIPEAVLSATLPGVFAVMIGAAVIIAVRFLQTLLEDGKLVAVRFDRQSAEIELTWQRMFGLTRQVLPFSAIRALRMSRGKWDDDRTTQIPVLVLMDKSAVALPEALSGRELTLLKLLTDLRGD